MILAVSDQVWLALIQLLTLIVGLVSVWMQQRNKNVTVTKTEELTKALAENTELTQKTHDAVKDKA